MIVHVTDGGDTTSSKDFHAADSAAQLADAAIYPMLVVPIASQAGRNARRRERLTTMPQWTGGRVFSPTIGAALDEAFTGIIRELRTQYMTVVSPSKERADDQEGGSTAWKQEVRRPDLRVTARTAIMGARWQVGSGQQVIRSSGRE